MVGRAGVSIVVLRAHVDHSLLCHGTPQMCLVALMIFKMSLREMITPLPIPGAVFTLAKRVLCPAIVPPPPTL